MTTTEETRKTFRAFTLTVNPLAVAASERRWQRAVIVRGKPEPWLRRPLYVEAVPRMLYHPGDAETRERCDHVECGALYAFVTNVTEDGAPIAILADDIDIEDAVPTETTLIPLREWLAGAASQ